MVDAGQLALAAGYLAVTLTTGLLCVRLGIALERDVETAP
jgi:hypothetical protein